MKEKACKGSSPQMLPKRTLLILPFIIINPPTQGCKLLPLLSIISTLQLGFKWHPPGSADTRMAKRVKMIFASLVADILFSSHFFCNGSLVTVLLIEVHWWVSSVTCLS